MTADDHPSAAAETLAFYVRFYAAIASSRAYAQFCERVFGRNFGQHGFADMAQIEALLACLTPGPGDHVLDLGCGNGAMDAYIAEVTGAQVTGIDISSEAINQAQRLAQTPSTHRHPAQLAFHIADIASLPFPPGSFDVLIAIDTLYFTDLDPTVAQMKTLLRPGGRMGMYWSQGANPGAPIEVFPRETLPPDNTDLARALQRAGLAYQAADFTDADYRHAQLKRAVLLQLHPQFVVEDTLFLYDNRLGEADGVIAAIEACAHARYLYLINVNGADTTGRAEKIAFNAP